MSSNTMQRFGTRGQSADAIRFEMYTDFKDCCRDAVKNLRSVALKRLPGAVNESESRAFWSLMEMKPSNPWNPNNPIRTISTAFRRRVKGAPPEVSNYAAFVSSLYSR